MENKRIINNEEIEIELTPEEIRMAFYKDSRRKPETLVEG